MDHPAEGPTQNKRSQKAATPLELTDWMLGLAVLVLLAGAGWLVYGRAIQAPFVFDDRSSVVENVSIVTLFPLLGEGGKNGPLTPPRDTVTSGRPLVNLTLAINYHFGQLKPLGYHVFNLTLHILCAWLVWMIVRRTLRLPYFGGRLDQAAGPLAVVTALVWELHPLQTEAVEYVSQRTELMMAFFYLATLAASLRYWSARSSAAQTGWLLTAILACACGMACKEVMVTAPVIVLLFERTFITGSFRGALEKSWRLYLGLGLTWLVLLWLNVNAPRSGSTGFGVGLPASVWWWTQTKVVLIYLKLAIWPWPLSIHYDMPYHRSLASAWPYAIPVALLMLGTVYLVWRNRAVGFCGACLFVILSPTLVVPLLMEIVAERRMYLPMAALTPLAIVAGYLAVDWLRRHSAVEDDQPPPDWSAVKVTAISVGVLAAILGLVSSVRLTAYRDLLTIWQDVVNHQPDNVLALTTLGAQLNGAGRYDESIRTLEHALALQPDTMQLGMHKQLGAALVSAGREAEAIAHLQESLRIDPDVRGVERVLGVALFNMGRGTEAIEHLERALVAAPNDVGTYDSLGVALVVEDRMEDAIGVFLRALQIDPNSISSQANLAIAYAKANRNAEAVAAAEKAIQMAHDAGKPEAAARAAAWLQFHRQQQAAP